MENSSKNEKKQDSIKELKEKYLVYQERFSLPAFEELNKEFGIEKADKETEFLLREIIKVIIDKFQNYMRFIEGVLNPSNTSIFIFSVTKLIDNGTKQKLSEVYKKISEIELKIIHLDLESSEETEAEFIKNSYKTWKEIKKDLVEVIKFIEKNWEAPSEQSKKGYFG